MMRLLAIFLLMLMGTGHVWAGPGVALTAPLYTGGAVLSAPIFSGGSAGTSLYYAINPGGPSKLTPSCCAKPFAKVSLGFSLCSADIALIHTPVVMFCPMPVHLGALTEPTLSGFESANFIFRPPIV